jgi:hypothetical protein
MIKTKYYLIIFVVIASYINGAEFVVDGMFSLNYPEDKVEVYDFRKGEPQRSKEKMWLYIFITDLNKLTKNKGIIEEDITFLDYKGIIEDKENLSKGKLNKKEYFKMIKPEIMNIDKTKGKWFLVLSKPVLDSIFFQLNLEFYHDNYRIILVLDNHNNKDLIALENPDCYTKEVYTDKFGSNTVYYLNYDNKNYKDIFYASLSNPDKKYTYDWNKTFNDIIQSIKILYEVYLKPTASGLRLRETPDQQGNIIRKLDQNEKLEFMERGVKETINDIKGNWVKVKTEKGEIGWCFDGYLEEVKDDNVKKK